MQKQIFKTPQIKTQKELRRKAKGCYRNIQRGKNEEVASGSKKNKEKNRDKKDSRFISVSCIVYKPPFSDVLWSLGKRIRPWQRNCKASGSCAEEEGGPASAVEVWEGQDGAGRGSSFLLCPFTMSGPSNIL